jgi:hypothetical protein
MRKKNDRLVYLVFANKLLQGVNGTQKGEYCTFRKLRENGTRLCLM